MEALERKSFSSLKRVCKVLAEYADSHSLNQEEYARYQESVWRARDNYDLLHDAVKRGLDKGRAEGWAEGWAEGKAENQRENAINLLKLGVSPETVAQGTGLTPEEVEKLKKHL